MRLIVVAALVIGLVACGGSAAPAAQSSAAPTVPATPAPLFTQAGSGSIDLTAPFTTTGNWWLAWAFDCPVGDDSLSLVAIYRQSDATAGSAKLFDLIQSDLGTSTGETRESQDTTAGPPAGIFYLKITSACSWNVVVK